MCSQFPAIRPGRQSLPSALRVIGPATADGDRILLMAARTHTEQRRARNYHGIGHRNRVGKDDRPRPREQRRSGHPGDGLLRWYDRHRRTWQPRSVRPDPYHVWLNEIMLQQTTVAAVAGYFQRFLSAGRRSGTGGRLRTTCCGPGRLLRLGPQPAKCAVMVAEGGRPVPEEEAELRRLPGIGDIPRRHRRHRLRPPCRRDDGNVERVVARLFCVTDPLPPAKPKLRALTDPDAGPPPGDFAQAMMDLAPRSARRAVPNASFAPGPAPAPRAAAVWPRIFRRSCPSPNAPARHRLLGGDAGERHPAAQAPGARAAGRDDRGTVSEWREAPAPALGRSMARRRSRRTGACCRPRPTHLHAFPPGGGRGRTSRPDEAAGLWCPSTVSATKPCRRS